MCIQEKIWIVESGLKWAEVSPKCPLDICTVKVFKILRLFGLLMACLNLLRICGLVKYVKLVKSVKSIEPFWRTALIKKSQFSL